jgi:hypothetical protein
MGNLMSSWLRDFGRHFVLYLAAGAAFLPAAAVYALLRSYGQDHSLLVAAAFLAGLAAAAVVWSRMQSLLARARGTRPEEESMLRIEIQASPFVATSSASASAGAIGITRVLTVATPASPKIQMAEAAKAR